MVIGLLAHSICSAQVKSGRVEYLVSYRNDTLSPTRQQELKDIGAFLYFDTHIAIFVYDAEKDKREMIGNVVYTNLNQKQMCIRRVIPGTRVYTYEPTLPKLKWQIYPENKTIAHYNCQKAVTFFRGRAWEVWFTTEIPVSFGPWKLHGLPGLILEASTQDQVISLRYKSIEIPPSQEFVQHVKEKYASIPYHKKDIQTSWQEYKEHYKTRIDKIVQEITEQMNAEEERLPPEEKVKYHFVYRSYIPEWELNFE
ncbi:MAG: GLPGLI family protein [Bacteroidia bacterium]|nr:GLPGLI family protein [Bacteroidia bacterium]